MEPTELEHVEKTYRRFGSSRWAWNALSIAGFGGWEPKLRRRAVEHLDLRPGDAVLDVACGRGSNFPYLQRAVGSQGRIVGVDYSPDMLAAAGALARQHAWTNVELVRADAASLDYNAEFDGALCTIAMSVIPGWQDTLRCMIAAVRPDKRIAIMDAKSAAEQSRMLRPFARWFAGLVAADVERDVRGELRRDLTNIREESYVFGGYYVLSGVGRRHV